MYSLEERNLTGESILLKGTEKNIFFSEGASLTLLRSCGFLEGLFLKAYQGQKQRLPWGGGSLIINSALPKSNPPSRVALVYLCIENYRYGIL